MSQKPDTTVVGFDFGTTNSLVSVIRSRGAINLFGQDQLPIPSVVCYEGNQTIVGRAAKERLANAGLGVQGNVVRSPKLYLGKDSVFLDGIERSPVDIVADVVDFVRREAISAARKMRRLDLGIDRAVVTIPVNMEGRRRAALRDACTKAGLSIVQFVHEPLAALYGFPRSVEDEAAIRRTFEQKLLLVLDWGGGTLDVTLCRMLGNALVQIISDGTDEIGGDVFDDWIRNDVLRRVAQGPHETGEPLPNAMARLLDQCERAKIELSTRPQLEIFVSSFFRAPGSEQLECPLTRADLAAITAPLVKQGMDRVRRLLDAADATPQQVAMCLGVGGMVRMPAIRERLHELFGPERVQIPDNANTLVAEGAAWVAHDEARLTLAKHVELLLARNSFMRLISAGTEMPREREVRQNEFDLYCVDPTDGTAKFQIQAPARSGSKVHPNDRRISLDNLVISVDSKAKPFRERLKLAVRIDDNLILHVQARSLEKRDMAETEIHGLEFGLALPVLGTATPPEASDDPHAALPLRRESGGVTMRGNVSNKIDNLLVPGEVLYRHEPVYFRDHGAPIVQEHERLYYEPCAGCGRSSSDPLCRCDPQRHSARVS